MERTGFTRLKVKFSAQVLSGSMALCLETYGGGCKSHKQGRNACEECGETQRYLRWFDQYIDVMNSGTFRKVKLTFINGTLLMTI